MCDKEYQTLQRAPSLLKLQGRQCCEVIVTVEYKVAGERTV